MPTFLAIQHTFTNVEVALCRDNTISELIHIDKLEASKILVPELDALLKRNKITLSEIQFIAANQGPGPFTTLRVVIATINGISFTRKIPLIGIDGLEAMAQEYSDSAYPQTAILLNAFSAEVYFALQTPHKDLETGYENNTHFFERIKQQIPTEPIRFLGNAVQLYHNEIQNIFGSQAYIPEQLPQTCSLNQIARMGLMRWNNKEDFSTQLLPLYLKIQRFK
jgi:tRNA threonylcarbamoyladenosine biosynthesis protein TsaB